MKQLLQLIFLCCISSWAFSQGVPELMYYKFDGTGNTVPNLASTPAGTNPATILGNQTQGPTGQFGGALIGIGGNSNTDYMNTGWAPNLAGADWTISLWLGGNVPSATTNYFFGESGAGSFRMFTGGVAGTGVYMRGAGLTDVIIPGPLFTNPVVLTFVYDSSIPEVRAYVDGALTVTQAQPGANLSGAGPFKVGGYGAGNNTTGLIDEFRFYNRALTATEISATWNLPLPLVTGPKDMAAVGLSSPAQGASGCYGSSETVAINVWNFGSDTVFFDTDTVQVTCNITGTNPQSFTTELNTGFMAPGTSMPVVMTTTYDMSVGGPYTFDAYTEFLSGGPDANPANDTMTTATVTSNSIAVLPGAPWVEDFETFVVGTPGTLQNGWTRGTSATPNWYVEDATGANENSSNTGPWFDNTLFGTPGGIYMYIETSGGTVGAVYELVSPCIDLSAVSGPTLEYAYHMYGADMGFLVTQVLSAGQWITVDSLDGQQQSAGGDPWGTRSVSLGAYAGQVVQIRFLGQNASSGFEGDASIDDVTIFEPAPYDLYLQAITNPPNPACSFTSTENITIDIQNVGANTINLSDVEASFLVTGPTSTGPVTETLSGTLTPGAILNYTFTTTADLSIPGLYTIAAAVDFSTASGLTDGALFNNFDTVAVQPGLVGTYTIDGATPTGGTNYQTFNEAATALNTFGVCGPVLFNVAPGTYAEQVTLGEIIGISAVNTVTFDGGTATVPILTHDGATGEQATVLLNGADYISFKNLTIENTAASEGWGVLLTNEADHNTIDSCLITVNPSGTFDVAGIIASGSTINDRTAGVNASYLTVSNSVITGGEMNITLEGVDGNPSQNYGNTIINNTLTGADDYGINMDDQDSVTIRGNSVSGLRNNFAEGLYLFDVDNFVIEENQVHAPDWAMYLVDGNDAITPSSRSRIINNMISSDTDYGMYIIDIESTDIFHNNTLGAVGFRLNDPISIDIRNNIFVGTTNYAVWADDGVTGLDSVNYNLYYRQSTGDLANLGSAGIAADLAALQFAYPNFNMSSLEGNPDYVSNTNLHIAGTLPNNVGDPSVGVTGDIDGETRNAATPDIGADEFTPLPTDLGAMAFVMPITGCGLSDSSIVSLVVRNFGTDTAFNFSISYQIGGNTFTESVSDTLPPGISKVFTFATTVDLSAMATYSFDGWPTLAGDTNNGNDTVFNYQVEHLPAISSFPYVETFDNPGGTLPAGWIQQIDDDGQDWLFDSGGTPTGGTGPSVDHTFGTTSGFYAYVEDSGNDNDSVTLITPCFDISGLNAARLTFWYHSNNSDGPGMPSENELHLDLIWNGTIIYDFVPAIGHKDNLWNFIEVDMSPYSGVFAVRFRVNNNNSDITHDIAIDDLGVDEVLPQDAGITNLVSPLSSCGLGSSDSMVVLLANLGTDSINVGVDVSYQINGGPITTVTIPDTLPPFISIPVFFPGIDFSTPGVYNIQVWTSNLAGDSNTFNDTLTTVVVSDPSTPLPITEDFDALPQGATIFTHFVNDPDGDYNWQVDAGGTPSTNTGPADDVSGGGNYIFIESSVTPSTGQKAILASDCIDLTTAGNPQLFYAYHMFGANTGSLNVEVEAGNLTTNVASFTGAQQSSSAAPWGLDTVDLTPFIGQVIRIRFIGTLGGSTTSDMALDQIVVRELVDDDVGVLGILSPPATDCSDDSSAVEVILINTGTMPQSNIPVTVSIGGAGSSTVSGVFPGPLNPGDTASFTVGTFNSNAGGVFTYASFTTLPGDTIIANDTAFASTLFTITATAPMVVNDSVCATDSAEFFLMATSASDAHIWYDSIAGGNLLAVGDTFQTGFLSGSRTYYVEAANLATDSLTTTFQAGNGCGGGNMFDLTANNNVRLDSFTISPNNFQVGVVDSVTVWYIPNNTYQGNETNQAAWTFLGGTTFITQGDAVPVTVDVGATLTIPPGATYAIYVEYNANYTTAANTFSNGDLTLNLGVGLCSSFGGLNNPRTFNGTLWYTSLGCPSERVPVTAVFAPPVAVDLGPDRIDCSGLILDASGAGIVSYQWQGDPAFALPTFTADTSGLYYVDVVNAQGCTGTDSVILTLNPSPTVNLGPDTTACGMITLDAGNPGGGATYIWSEPGQFSQTLDVMTSGTYSVIVSRLGCVGTDTVNVVVEAAPVVDLGVDLGSCDPVVLDAGNPGETIVWSTGETSQTITVMPPMSGGTPDTVSVSVTNAAGCETVDEIIISAGVAPVVDLGPDTTVCDVVMLDAGNSGATYTWGPGGETTQTINVTTSGEYAVTVVDAVGCENVDTVDVTVQSSPDADFTFSASGLTYTFTNTSTGGGNYIWDFGDGSPTVTDPNPVHTYPLAGGYEVTLIATNNCGDDTLKFVIDNVDLDDLFSSMISIYPNPTKGRFEILGEGITAEELTIEVNDQRGREVFRKVEKHVAGGFRQAVDLTTEAEGVYLVKITDGERTAYKRVIKE